MLPVRAALVTLLLCAGCGVAPASDEQDIETPSTDEHALWADRSCSVLLSRGGEPLVAGFSHGLVLRSWVFVARVDMETVLVFGTGYAPLIEQQSAWTQMANCLDVLYGSSEPKDALVVFDHWHYDHTQGYRSYNAALRNVRYLGHALDADKEAPGSLECPTLFGVPAGYAHYDYPSGAPFEPLPGDSYPGLALLETGGWTVRWCPGHTAGTVCVTNDAEDIVLASDWVSGHGLLLPCGNDDPAAGFTSDAEGCGENPELDATDCIGQSRELTSSYETRCNAHGRAGRPCCGWIDGAGEGTLVTECE